MAYSLMLETERLYLREMRDEDAEHFYNLNNDPEVLKHTGDAKFESINASKLFLKNYPNISYLKDGYGRWTCIRKQDNSVIGWCGLRKQFNGEIDLGYRLFKENWSQGYATEASIKCLDYGFNVLSIHTIIARAAKDNIASWKVMEKLGMTFRNDEYFHGQDGFVYHISKAEWILPNIGKSY